MPKLRSKQQDQSRQVTWQGQALLQVGLGAFLGQSGDNRFHQHWAHQIVIGLNGPFKLATKSDAITSNAIWIDAGLPHQLGHASVLCIYLDPRHTLSSCLQTIKQFPTNNISELDESLSRSWSRELNEDKNLNAFVERLVKEHWQPPNTEDSILAHTLATLWKEIEMGNDPSREKLAEIAHLSPSRFSHWFREEKGIALRSYKKWSRLILAFQLAQTRPLTEAALSAGFSDQAHFCRTVDKAFGVNPKLIQTLLK